MSQNTLMLRPHQLDQVPGLRNADQVKSGLASLWNIYDNAQPGSQQKLEAESRIKQASGKVWAHIQQTKGRAQGQVARPGSGGGPVPGQPASNAAQMSQAQQTQAHIQAQAAARLQAGGQQGAPALSAKQQQELDTVNIVVPPSVSLQNQERYKTEMSARLQQLIQKRDQAVHIARQKHTAAQLMTQQGHAVPDQLRSSVHESRQLMDKLVLQWKTVVAQATGVNTGPSQDHRPANSQQDAKPVANSDTQRTSTSPTQPQPSFPQQQPQQQPQQTQSQQQQQQQQQQPPPAVVATSSTMGQQNLPQQAPPPQPTPSQQSQQHQQPQRVAQPASQQARPGPNFPQNSSTQQPQTQQQQRPQINTQQLSSQSVPQASHHPPSTISTNANQAQGPPQALSHQAAMSQAAEQYSRQQAQTPSQQAPQQMPNGMPYSSQLGSGTQQNTPTSAYPHLQGAGQQSNTSVKFGIPKTLNVDPRINQEAKAPPSRPTLANQGMMFHPGIAQRPPPYTLEGEGDRVLSKRKLDELVRQVTGAAPSSKNGESAAVLSPEVEESMMQVADNFVDDVIGAACRLAKLRGNGTLEIKDVQLVLERNYGIRIPGYSLDEVRTVRKFQPAPGWQSKMQAVQAGKVMGSRES